MNRIIKHTHTQTPYNCIPSNSEKLQPKALKLPSLEPSGLSKMLQKICTSDFESMRDTCALTVYDRMNKKTERQGERERWREKKVRASLSTHFTAYRNIWWKYGRKILVCVFITNASWKWQFWWLYYRRNKINVTKIVWGCEGIGFESIELTYRKQSNRTSLWFCVVLFFIFGLPLVYHLLKLSPSFSFSNLFIFSLSYTQTQTHAPSGNFLPLYTSLSAIFFFFGLSCWNEFSFIYLYGNRCSFFMTFIGELILGIFPIRIHHKCD